MACGLRPCSAEQVEHSSVEATDRTSTRPPAVRRVLIVPFQPIDRSDDVSLGRGIEATLSAELARLRGCETVAYEQEVGHLGVRQAQEIGEAADADFAVFGSYQRSGEQVRATGYVVSVESGEVIGSLKATSPDDDLFVLQDTIAAQVRHALPQPSTETVPTPVSPITYSGPVQARAAAQYTPAIRQPKMPNDEHTDARDRYFRRPGPAYPFWGWGCYWGWRPYRWHSLSRYWSGPWVP
jgi:TolB-like protein